jgi:hypothetical protein
LPGIETIERNDDTIPSRVDVYLRHESNDRGLKRRPARLLCSFNRDCITVSGLDQWGRYQVLLCGWGKLVDDAVSVYLPRDRKELETVWIIVQSAHDRLFGTSEPEAGSLIISTWDWPRSSRTSLQ